jgi:hypothetical protein
MDIEAVAHGVESCIASHSHGVPKYYGKDIFHAPHSEERQGRTNAWRSHAVPSSDFNRVGTMTDIKLDLIQRLTRLKSRLGTPWLRHGPVSIRDFNRGVRR